MSLQARIDRARRLLAGVEKNYAPATFGCAFGAEDMVVLDLIARDGLAIATFTLDTGRLPRQTHELIAKVRRQYGLEIDVFAPWPDSVDGFVEQYGTDGFLDGVEQRQGCCAVRRAEPMRRALARKRGWITSLRREIAASGAELLETALDPVHGLWKFSPLADWSHDEVWQYLRDNGVPFHPLHGRGYASIGCEPCNRAARPGEHPRAGRWWWERAATNGDVLQRIAVRVEQAA